MIPVYYFDKMPEVLPPDDACYIVSKYIYLKKRTGLIDSLVKVNSIDMGEEVEEYAHMNLPKIKASVFGRVVGFFGMVYDEYKSEAGTILNLYTHPTNEKLKKIDFTVPHQEVSHGGCKYQIVVDKKYLNCGTIHSHCDFGAFHSGTDQNDERYFDGFHITVGHVNQKVFSVSASIVINGKRVKVDPLDYIDGIRFVKSFGDTSFYEMIDRSLVVQDRRHLDFVKPRYPRNKWGGTFGTNAKQDTLFDYDEIETTVKESNVNPCKSCVFKEIRIDDLLDDITLEPAYGEDEFMEGDRLLFERINTQIFKDGEVDEDGIKRSNNRISREDYLLEKRKVLKRNIKCSKCTTTFFVPDPEVSNLCPNCSTVHPAQRYTFSDFMAASMDEEAQDEKRY